VLVSGAAFFGGGLSVTSHRTPLQILLPFSTPLSFPYLLWRCPGGLDGDPGVVFEEVVLLYSTSYWGSITSFGVNVLFATSLYRRGIKAVPLLMIGCLVGGFAQAPTSC